MLEFTFDVELVLKIRGKTVIDRELFEILHAVAIHGSLHAAANALGLPYSRVWEKVRRAEALLGRELLIRRRGVRGVALTEFAKWILNIYRNHNRRIGIAIRRVLREMRIVDVIVAGSHDPLLERLISDLAEEISIDVIWTGSLGGVLSLLIGEAEIAGIHLLDKRTNTYNTWILELLDLKPVAVLIRGWKREIGIAFNENLNVRDLRDIVTKKLRIANRIAGAGTRILLDILLEDLARKYGIKCPWEIPGYSRELLTHWDVANAIKRGEADVGLTLRCVAEAFDLGFIPLRWENFDFIVHRRALNRETIKKFIKALKEQVKDMINDLNGYEIPPDIGKEIPLSIFSSD